MTAERVLDQNEKRDLFLDRRVCTVTPEKIDVHPARSIIFLPMLTLLMGLSVFPAVYFLGDWLPVPILVLMTMFAIVVVPLSGLGIVYSIAGAHLVIDRKKQSAVLQQGYLGMGVGTQELIPFWKINKIVIKELTPHDWRGHHEDFAQYEIYILKASGKQINVGMVTTARAEAEDGLERAREIADLIADMAGSEVHELNITLNDDLEDDDDYETAVPGRSQTRRRVHRRRKRASRNVRRTVKPNRKA